MRHTARLKSVKRMCVSTSGTIQTLPSVYLRLVTGLPSTGAPNDGKREMRNATAAPVHSRCSPAVLLLIY